MTDGVFACTTGDMPLSRAVNATLTERFPTPRPRPAGVESGRRPGRWFCPGCGVPLSAEMTCSMCGTSIRDLLFPLVELHPHADV